MANIRVEPLTSNNKQTMDFTTRMDNSVLGEEQTYDVSSRWRKLPVKLGGYSAQLRNSVQLSGPRVAHSSLVESFSNIHNGRLPTQEFGEQAGLTERMEKAGSSVVENGSTARYQESPYVDVLPAYVQALHLKSNVKGIGALMSSKSAFSLSITSRVKQSQFQGKEKDVY